MTSYFFSEMGRNDQNILSVFGGIVLAQEVIKQEQMPRFTDVFVVI